MDVQFIISVAVITPDPSVSRRLYVDALGLALTAEGDGYLHSEDIDGCKSFGVWPLTSASPTRPRRISSEKERSPRADRPLTRWPSLSATERSGPSDCPISI